MIELHTSERNFVSFFFFSFNFSFEFLYSVLVDIFDTQNINYLLSCNSCKPMIIDNVKIVSNTQTIQNKTKYIIFMITKKSNNLYLFWLLSFVYCLFFIVNEMTFPVQQILSVLQIKFQLEMILSIRTINDE